MLPAATRGTRSCTGQAPCTVPARLHGHCARLCTLLESASSSIETPALIVLFTTANWQQSGFTPYPATQAEILYNRSDTFDYCSIHWRFSLRSCFNQRFKVFNVRSITKGLKQQCLQMAWRNETVRQSVNIKFYNVYSFIFGTKSLRMGSYF